MGIDEKTRLDLGQWFAQHMGPRLADAIMEAMPPVDYERLATKADVALSARELRAEMAEVRGDVAELGGELRAEVSGLRTEMVTGFAGVEAQFAEVRGEMVTGFAGLRSEIADSRVSMAKWMIATQLTTISVVLGGVALLV
ncbi:MAG: hypothetical protein GY929_17510 [Actinomycetia bacterium]|nr:hypothetical protein [Actinomycetes bacterium]